MPGPKKRLSPRKQPTQSRSKDLVEQLIKSTARILVRDGLAGFNTNWLAEVSGVSVGSIYQYFPNKDSLISAVIERKLFEDRQAFTEKMASYRNASFEEQMEVLILTGIEHHRRDQKLMKVIFSQLGGSGQAEAVEKVHQELFLSIRSLIAARFNKSSGSALVEKSYLVLQLILAVWHSQVEANWSELDAKRVTMRTLEMIKTCVEAD